jgi:hypothetical protein
MPQLGGALILLEEFTGSVAITVKYDPNAFIVQATYYIFNIFTEKKAN